jgi:acyl CoA:acetate/3-ketoacid CoA transferase beta subunit
MLASHVNKQGEAKVVERCTLPLTGVACVDRIYSDLAVIDVTPGGLYVTAMVEGMSSEELQSMTAASLTFADDCRRLSTVAA